jgi:hypothetical protein
LHGLQTWPGHQPGLAERCCVPASRRGDGGPSSKRLAGVRFARVVPGQFPNNRNVSQVDEKVKENQVKPLKQRTLSLIA